MSERPVTFSLSMSWYQRIRRKLLVATFVGYGTGLLVFLFLRFLYPPDNPASDSITLFLLTVISVVSTRATLKKQRKIGDTYRLTITGNAIIRQQHNTPDISILKSEVKKITKHPNGVISVTGNSKLNAIGVPAGIENPIELERLLTEIMPIATQKNTAWQKLAAPAMLIVITTVCLGLLSDNIFILTLSGVFVCALFIVAFIVIHRSKHFDLQLKRLSYFFLIPLLSIISYIVMMWVDR